MTVLRSVNVSKCQEEQQARQEAGQHEEWPIAAADDVAAKAGG